MNPFGPPGQMPPMPMIGPDGQPSYYLVPATGMSYQSIKRLIKMKLIDQSINTAGFMPGTPGGWNGGIPPGSPMSGNFNMGGPKTPSSITSETHSPLMDTPWPKGRFIDLLI